MWLVIVALFLAVKVVHGSGSARGTLWMNSTAAAELVQAYANQYGAILEPALCDDIRAILSNNTIASATVTVTSWNVSGRGNAAIAVAITIESTGADTVALTGMVSNWNSALAVASAMQLPLNQSGVLLKRLMCTPSSGAVTLSSCNQSAAAFLTLIRTEAVAVIGDNAASDGCLGISCFGLAMVCVLCALVFIVAGGTYYCCAVYRGKAESNETVPTTTSTDRDGQHPYTTSNRFKSTSSEESDSDQDPFAVDVAPVNDDPFGDMTTNTTILRGSIADRRGVPATQLPLPIRESGHANSGSSNTTPTAKVPKGGWPSTSKGDRTPALPPAASRRPSFVTLPPDMAEERKKLESQSWIWQHLE